MAASGFAAELHMTKYDNIRSEWTRLFENKYRHKLGTVRTFFQDFHKNHKQLEFTIAKIFDGSKQILVDTEQFTKIKKELERKTGETLPKVRDYVFRNGIGYTFVERKSFASWSEYRECSNILERENNAEKNRQRTEASSQAAELRQTIKAKPRIVFLVFDIEVYEHDSKKILEIGFVKFGVHSDVPKEYFHYIITDNLQYVNEDVPDNRNNFRHGESKQLSLKEAAAQFQEHVATADSLVTHAGENDVEFLAMQGVVLPEKKMFDTQVLALALLPRGPQLRSLKRIMADVGVSYNESDMHNAGNDAALTMKAFCGLAKKL